MRLRTQGLHWRRVEDEIVLLDGNRYLSINDTGAALWPLLEAGTDRDALVACLVERYEVEPARAAADVDAFVADLRAHGLVT